MTAVPEPVIEHGHPGDFEVYDDLGNYGEEGECDVMVAVRTDKPAASAPPRVEFSKPGHPFAIWPGTENTLPVEEWSLRRDAWLARNRPLLEGFTSRDFIAWKRREVAEGRL